MNTSSVAVFLCELQFGYAKQKDGRKSDVRQSVCNTVANSALAAAELDTQEAQRDEKNDAGRTVVDEDEREEAVRTVSDRTDAVRIEDELTEDEEAADQVPEDGEEEDAAVVARVAVEEEDDAENAVDDQRDGQHRFTWTVALVDAAQ